MKETWATHPRLPGFEFQIAGTSARVRFSISLGESFTLISLTDVIRILMDMAPHLVFGIGEQLFYFRDKEATGEWFLIGKVKDE